jgi:hypothetical protein
MGRFGAALNGRERIAATSSFISFIGHQMKIRTIRTAVASLAMILVLTTGALAQNSRTIVEKFNIPEGMIYNPCCDEWLTFSATIHTTFNIKNNADGSMTITQNIAVSKVKSTGSNGNNYVGSENVKSSFTITEGQEFPLSVRDHIYTRITGTGRNGHDCSAWIKTSFTLEIDAEGNVTTEDYTYEVICANGNTIE